MKITKKIEQLLIEELKIYKGQCGTVFFCDVENYSTAVNLLEICGFDRKAWEEEFPQSISLFFRGSKGDFGYDVPNLVISGFIKFRFNRVRAELCGHGYLSFDAHVFGTGHGQYSVDELIEQSKELFEVAQELKHKKTKRMLKNAQKALKTLNKALRAISKKYGYIVAAKE